MRTGLPLVLAWLLLAAAPPWSAAQHAPDARPPAADTTAADAAVRFLLAQLALDDSVRAAEPAVCLREAMPPAPVDSAFARAVRRAAARAGLAPCRGLPSRTNPFAYVYVWAAATPSGDPDLMRIEAGIHRSYHARPGDGGWTESWWLELQRRDGDWQVANAVRGTHG